jgi:hypothetical protein
MAQVERLRFTLENRGLTAEGNRRPAAQAKPSRRSSVLTAGFGVTSLVPRLRVATKALCDQPKRQNQLTHAQRRKHQEHNAMPE